MQTFYRAAYHAGVAFAILSFFVGTVCTFLGLAWFVRPALDIYFGIATPYWNAVFITVTGFLDLLAVGFLVYLLLRKPARIVHRSIAERWDVFCDKKFAKQ